MKNIEKEVKALEVAMAVASDLNPHCEKSYAYIVTRVQDALLGKDEADEEIPVFAAKSHDLEVSMSGVNSPASTALIISAGGIGISIRLHPVSGRSWEEESRALASFVKSFQKGDTYVLKNWNILVRDTHIYFLNRIGLNPRFSLDLPTFCASGMDHVTLLKDFLDTLRSEEKQHVEAV